MLPQCIGTIAEPIVLGTAERTDQTNQEQNQNDGQPNYSGCSRMLSYRISETFEGGNQEEEDKYRTTMKAEILENGFVKIKNFPTQISNETLDEFIYFLKFGLPRWERVEAYIKKQYTANELKDIIACATTLKCGQFEELAKAKLDGRIIDKSYKRVKENLEFSYWHMRGKVFEGHPTHEYSSKFDDSDVILSCHANIQNLEKNGNVRAHSYVLNRYVPTLRPLLKQAKEKQTHPSQSMRIKMPHTDMTTMESVLYYIYTDTVAFQREDYVTGIVTAHEWRLTNLVEKLANLIVRELNQLKEKGNGDQDKMIKQLVTLGKKLNIDKLANYSQL
mmetsp:Transcript_1218/g.1854  ORF Transcript_1218/g.1854 Transcript_1218/m.1854 type:complete len:333 (+) Transcript_1218:19-1017(+)